MEKCKFCGDDTELYIAGVPTCVECSKDAERQRKVLETKPSGWSTSPFNAEPKKEQA